MTREQISPTTVERRCPNCGTRVARDADSCFMCGHNLRIQAKRTQRIAWVDVVLVLAVVAVLVLWWRMGSQPQPGIAGEANAKGIFPTSVPLMTATNTPGPSPTPTASPAPATPVPNYIKHEVEAGETLLEIANNYNITVQELQAANNINDELIHIGDELIIPVLSSEPAPTAVTTTGGASPSQYVVRSGDTIISIALTFGSSIEEIRKANNLGEDDLIRPGDVLNVPTHQLPPEVSQSGIQTTTNSAAGTTLATPATTDTIYIEPRLIGPPDETTLPRTEAVLLRWISVDVLAPNEWYVLLISPAADNAKSLPSIWTKSTSYRLDTSMAPEVGQSATYIWQVSVVRVKTGSGGQTGFEAASPPSELRYFTWK
ncbi:MAG: LysM peptidoglycan-binding domain-containing protein [Chloroflexi bacterium]|nr:LysM peptidoglycan-binding domain-containing protein [Chloroflexota bacterium]